MADTNSAPQAPTEARVRELERRLAVVEPLLAAVAKEHADTRRQDNESMRALGRTPMPAKHCPCRICIAVRASALAGGTADPEAREGALRAILADNLIAEEDGFRCLWCDTFIQREHIDQPGSHLDERCPMRRLRAALAAGTPAPPPPEAPSGSALRYLDLLAQSDSGVLLLPRHAKELADSIRMEASLNKATPPPEADRLREALRDLLVWAKWVRRKIHPCPRMDEPNTGAITAADAALAPPTTREEG